MSIGFDGQRVHRVVERQSAHIHSLCISRVHRSLSSKATRTTQVALVIMHEYQSCFNIDLLAHFVHGLENANLDLDLDLKPCHGRASVQSGLQRLFPANRLIGRLIDDQPRNLLLVHVTTLSAARVQPKALS